MSQTIVFVLMIVLVAGAVALIHSFLNDRQKERRRIWGLDKPPKNDDESS